MFDGTFYREYASSYASNLLDDLGANFVGAPRSTENVHGEELSLEQLPAALGDIDVFVYGVQPDGSPEAGMADLFESPLWTNLPAVRAGRVIEIRHHSAATYPTAVLALESIRDELDALAAS